ncbi:MAG: glycosyltransferase family 2 protein [Nocardioides sp.]
MSETPATSAPADHDPSPRPPVSAPLVSVVIATRDRPEMVREAIQAVADQDLDAVVETIVVFDQSDPDPTLADSDPRRPVRVIANTHTAGLAGARNSGIDASTADFVAFCDDDDYWLPPKLRLQVALLEAKPGAGLATGGITVRYDNDEHPRTLDMDAVDFAELLRDRHTEMHPSTYLMRRSVLLDRIGLVSEEVPGGFGEDYEFLLRAAKVHPILNVDVPVAIVRWGKQSFFFRRWETMIAGLSWILERYPEFETSAVGAARIKGQIAFAHAAQKHRREALRWAARAFRQNPRELRAPLATAVAFGVISPARVMEILHHRGRGI